MAAWLEQNARTSSANPSSGYHAMDVALPRVDDTRWDKVFVALSFWDGWIDARNHDWNYYPGINESDWPVLGRHIVISIANDTPITQSVVLKRFERSKR